MSTVSKAVKFRALANKLDSKEYTAFLSNFLTKCGRNTVLTWLFQQFTSTNNNDTQSLDVAVHDIENIIQSREIKQDQPQIDKMRMDSLPDALHREIASYLKDKDYIAFSKSNRTIFVSCNSPNSLKYLDLTSVQNYSTINLQNFPQIEHLKININKFNECQLPPNGMTVCNHLSHLTLFGDDQTDINIAPFLAQNCWNFTNITQLKLSCFGTNDPGEFCRLLSKFNMIRYLRMNNVYCDTSQIDNNRLMESLPNLQGFEWNGGAATTPSQIVGLYGDTLKALKLWSDPQVTLPPNISLKSMQELMLWRPHILTVNTILKTARNLRKIELRDAWPPDIGFTGDDWKSTMYKLISDQKELQCLDIESHIDHFADICEGLESGVYETDTTFNDIKIKLEFAWNSSINVMKIFVYISRILQQLESSEIANFQLLLKVYIGSLGDKEEWNKGKEKFINKNRLKYEIYADGDMIAIRNKQCRMNDGYTESWLIHQD